MSPSSSKESEPENSETSRKADHNSIESWKNSTREDEQIYLAACSGEADRIFGAIRYLVAESSFSITEIIILLSYRIVRFQVRIMELLNLTNSVESLNEVMRYEMQYHGPDMLKGIILFITAIERPDRINLISSLLDLGCNINTKDIKARNILHRLVRKNSSSGPYLQVAELLIRRGIDINSKNKNDETPLEYAVIFENLEMLRLLLRCGATVRVSEFYMNFAHFAFVRGSAICFQAIIKFYLFRKIQGKDVEDHILDFIKTEEVSEHYNLCLQEIEYLKQNIVDTNVSLYDILFKPNTNVVKYLRNKDVLSEIQRNIMEKSEFSYDLAEILNEALIRRDLEDSSLVAFKHILKLPELVSEKIMSHLDNDELKSFSSAMGTLTQTKD
ncbi:stress-activated protein kinase alpha-like [Harmonia axyridis]|uniref:stress-activated protein kinase alpha-like n=1 Tax=Harmonia axyridis TaxID=115357 RepID=UPI001E27632B|nr:stress-activated protein kinase alpha-like [Harmonia axyridis]